MTFESAEEERAERNRALGLPGAVQLAPIWRRGLGQLIDQLVVLAPVGLVAVMLGIRSFDAVGKRTFAITVAGVCVAFVYQFVMIGLFGRTVGKFVLGTRAVRVDTGGRVPWPNAAIRALVPLSAGVIPKFGSVLTLIVYVNALFDRRRQGWHDKAAGTIVVMHGFLYTPST